MGRLGSWAIRPLGESGDWVFGLFGGWAMGWLGGRLSDCRLGRWVVGKICDVVGLLGDWAIGRLGRWALGWRWWQLSGVLTVSVCWDGFEVGEEWSSRKEEGVCKKAYGLVNDEPA